MSDKTTLIQPISHVQAHSREELVSRLRNVTMLKAPEVKVYASADIQVGPIDLSTVWPAQRYVLRSEFEKVRELRWTLARMGHDPLKLDGYLTLTFASGEVIDLLPPIVEDIVEEDGSVHSIINDGMHRMYLAWISWVSPVVAHVKNLPPEYPYYAYPLREQWAGVQMIERLTPEFVKKFHRIPDNKLLYRNFNSAFHNVGAPRGPGKESA